MKEAMEVLRPYLYGENPFGTLWNELSPESKRQPWNHASMMVTAIERQLGLIEDPT
ncbi:hypothetical protein P1X14_11160 [Sphingomonas sp. AOB5]|uniref:hypothetical protein n=1 Tax=Sphingomonas sp. AOB5 TaxID=3034017 RepID=UPI0023F94BC0|nr:hypothetical protein [Sphingomonas sp. AOB5]MDF7775806.1 hypothetical protein [Sphingomonas sp. AOB5]